MEEEKEEFWSSKNSKTYHSCTNQMQLWIGLKTVANKEFKLSRYLWKKAVLSFPHPEQIKECKCKACSYYKSVKGIK